MSRRLRMVVMALGALVAVPGAVPAQSAEAEELGRQFTAWFYDGAIDQLWPRISSELGSQLGGKEGLRAFREQVLSQLGTETRVVDERVTRVGDNDMYVRVVQFENQAGAFNIVWAIGGGGAIDGFVIAPPQEAAESRFLDHRTRTPLRLPFDGEWTVFWGGRTIEENYHVTAPDQRFAYDLVVARDGARHTGDGTINEQYHCFGLEVLAPGAGEVVAAGDGIADNRPGVMNPAQPLGNHVILDHGNGEYSFLAHFKEGSVRVSEGDHVVAGQVLGQCGNSGNSSEAHLHYHLQTTPDYGAGEGLPAQFRDYVADGEAVEWGEPTQGQRIRPAGVR